MSNPLSLRSLVGISLGLHISALGIFGFSFPGAPVPASSQLVFLGDILPRNAAFPSAVIQRRFCPRCFLSEPNVASAPLVESPIIYTGEAVKPAAKMARAMPVFQPGPVAGKNPLQNTASVLMFHPLLPYQLQLYFKDRETVHIELMFDIVSQEGKEYIVVKRKISSGSLDADLLCSRYIGHYLFIQRSSFAANKWQSVKIDLSKQGEGD